MLTNNDFAKIKLLVNDVVTKVVTEVVNTVVDAKLKKELKPIKKQLNKMQRDLDTTINFFDVKNINHEKRITKIENKIGIDSPLY